MVIFLIMTVFTGMTVGSRNSGTRASKPTLTNAGINPNKGNISTIFTFNVTYKDADGDMPLYVLVIINNINYNMTLNGSNAKKGISCYYSTTLSAGNHSYYFYAMNAMREYATNPVNDTYYLLVKLSPGTNRTPQLYNPQYSPLRPMTNQTINFTVQYKDLDNDAPTNVSLFIKDSNSSIFANYGMILTGNSYSTGITCFRTLKLKAGSYDYYFLAKSKNDTVIIPPNGTYNLYVAFGSNNNPPVLTGGSVSPYYGTANKTWFNFAVYYMDYNLNPANISLVYINNIQYNMTGDLKNISYSGIYYYYQTQLPVGNHTYYFEFSNGEVNVTYPANSKFKGPLVTKPGKTPPYLTDGGVSPYTGKSYKTLFNYSVIYQDGNFGSAKIHYVCIDNWLYNMTENRGDSGSKGIYYSYSTYLSAGPHKFYFIFSDGRINITLPSIGTFIGPNVTGPDSNSNRPPSASIRITPLKGDTNTTFYFNGSGVDPEGKNLTYSWAFSDGINISGKKNIARKFNTSDNYSVTLTVKDIWGLTGIASAKFLVTRSNVPPPKNNPPVIRTNIKKTNNVKLNTTLYISALSSYDPDRDPLTFKWIIIDPYINFPIIFKVAAFNYTFGWLGNYSLQLTVSDGKTNTVDTFTFICSKSNIPPRNQKPVAKASVTVSGMTAKLSGAGSYDQDGKIVKYSWKIGSITYKGKYYNHTSKTYGYKTAILTVTDNGSLTDQDVIGFYIYNRSRPNESKIGNLDYNGTNIGGHVEITGDVLENALLSVVSSGFGFKVTLIESKENYLKFLIESESDVGRLIIIDIENNLIDLTDQKLVKLKMDNSDIKFTDFEKIIKASGDNPYYNIITVESKYQLLVYIPYFSEHTIEVEVESREETTPSDHFTFDVISWPLLLIVIVIIIITLLLVFQEIRKKKEKEFYYDFRVAEDKTNNGLHPKPEKKDEENWDDFI